MNLTVTMNLKAIIDTQKIYLKRNPSITLNKNTKSQEKTVGK